MNLTALMLATLIGGCGGKLAMTPSAAAAASLPPTSSEPLATAPAASLHARVCVFGCSGPMPVDADGNVYAATYLDIHAATPLAGVALSQFELLDAAGMVVSHGTPAAPLWVLSGQSAGRFSGNLIAGSHVRLWVSMRLDAQVAELKRLPAVRFRLSLTIPGRSPLTATGEVTAAGATG